MPDANPFASLIPSKAAPPVNPFAHLIPKPDPGDVVRQDVPGSTVTSTWRSRRHNAEVGGVSDSYHLKDEAADFKPPKGTSDADAMADIRYRDPHPRELLDEGDHIHYTPSADHEAPAPNPFASMIPAPANPFAHLIPKPEFRGGVGGAPKPGALADAVGAKGKVARRNPLDAYLDDTIGGTMRGAGHQVAQDFREDNATLKKPPPLVDQFTHPTAPGGQLRTPKELWDVAGAAMSPISGIADAVFARPLAKGEQALLHESPELEQKREASDLGALNALGPEAGRAGLDRPLPAKPGAPDPGRPITTDPVLPKPSVPKPPRAPARTLAAARERLADPTLEKPGGTADAIRDAATGAKRAVQSTFGASTMSDAARDAAAIVRRSGGESAAFHAQTARKLMAYDKIVGRASIADQRGMVDYIEGSGKAPASPGLREAADAIKGAFKSYRDRIEYVLEPEERPNFIENYYAHMWKEKPSVVLDRMNQFYRQGSGRSFKARTIPTQADGIEAGLTPRTENPIENTMTYSSNMQRYLHTLDVRGAMIKDGLAKMAPVGTQPDGWVPLEGIMTKKGSMAIQNADKEIIARRPEEQLYAPAEAARVYNRAISLGLEKGDVGPWYRAARRVANGASQMVLGLSGYHFTAETAHAMFSEIARGVQATAKGDLGQAAKSFGSSATVVGPAINSAVKGGALRKMILNADGFDNLPPVAKAYIEAGGRVKMDKLYSSSSGRTAYQAGKYDLVDAYKAQKQVKGFSAKTKAVFDATLHGSTALEMQRFRQGIMHGTVLERANKVGSLLPNVLQSVMGPLFEDYIPNLKAGAFAQRYADWLSQNPEAGREAQEYFGRKLSDHVDNRFGEMVQDNLFLAQELKQTAQILALAPGWDIGLLRELAGGVLDVPKSAKMLATGKGITENTAYLVALLAGGAYLNGVATYLKTGKMPGLADLQSYPTGGQTPYGDDERASIPGQTKDVYAQINALSQFATTGDPEAEEQILKNKMDPAAAFGLDVGTNTNWHGDAIFKGPGAESQEGDKNLLGRDAMNRFAPLIFGSMKGTPGSNISPVERLLGVRPAPFPVANPQGYKDWLAEKNGKKYRAAQTAAQREDAP